MPGIDREHEISNLENQIHDLMRKYDRRYKVEKIKINISSSFMARCRCYTCGSAPTFYYTARKRFAWNNVRNYVNVSGRLRGYLKRMRSEYYLNDEPSNYRDIQEFSFLLNDKSYLPILHRVRGNPSDRNNLTEFLSCECGDTTWAFNQKSTLRRSEIKNRKGRYKYPQHFEY